jgi:hypothetical protein
VSRTEHLEWCKERALVYVDAGDLQSAYVSLVSDLQKHEGTRQHVAIELGMALMMGGHLDSEIAMRNFIEGCN